MVRYRSIQDDGVAQLVERLTWIQRTKVQILSGAQDKFVSFSESKMCCLVVGVLNPCVYTHAQG